MALSVEDRLDILELVARYNHAIDSGNGKAWAETFTEDGVFETSRGKTEGHEALAKFVEGMAANMPGARHWNNNHVIEGDGDQATHTCYLMLVRPGAEPMSGSRYEDNLVKVNGQWKFAQRSVVS